MRWFDRDGQRQSAEGFTRKADAEAYCRELHLKFAGYVGPEREQALAWATAVGRFADTISGLSDKHEQYLSDTLAAFTAHARPRTVADVQPEHVATFLREMRNLKARVRYGRPCSACGWRPRWKDRRQSFSACERCGALPGAVSEATKRKAWSALRTVFNWFQRAGMIQRNPVLLVRAPLAAQTFIRVPSESDVRKLLAAAGETTERDPNGWYTLILAAYLLGLRRNELLGVTVADVDRQTDAEVAIVKYRRLKNRRLSERLRGAPPVLTRLLAERIEALELQTNDALWSFSADLASDGFKRIARRAGLAYSLHDLRRASATARAEDAAIRAGAGYLDHSDQQVFRRHYEDAARVALAVARAIPSPNDLPPCPAPARKLTLPSPRSKRTTADQDKPPQARRAE